MMRSRQWLAGAMLICAAGAASAESVASGAPAPLSGSAGSSWIDDALHAARAARNAGDSDAAVRGLSEVLRLAPNDSRILGEYGKALVETGHYDDALEYLHRALALTPDDWKLLVAEGVAYDEKGEYRHAQAAYAGALKLKPGNPDILSDSAISHARAGDFEGAKERLALAARHGASATTIAHIEDMISRGKAPRASVAAAPVSLSASPAGSLQNAADQPTVRPPGHFYILAGAFAVEANADKTAASLKALNAHVNQMQRNGQSLYAVTLGPFSTRAETKETLGRVKALSGINAQVVSH